MSSKPKPSVVVFVNDLTRVAKFYEAVLSMITLHSDEKHIVLDAESFQLVVHALPGAGESEAITAPPEVREDVAIKFCLPVPSIAEARSKAPDLGGMIYSEAHEWQARAFRACDGYDPEGNVIQVRESAV